MVAASSLAPYPALDCEKRHSSQPETISREHWKITVNQRTPAREAAGCSSTTARMAHTRANAGQKMKCRTLRPVYSQTAARKRAVPEMWDSRAITRLAFPDTDREYMSRAAQNVCAAHAAIQNRKKRAGRPRSRRK